MTSVMPSPSETSKTFGSLPSGWHLKQEYQDTTVVAPLSINVVGYVAEKEGKQVMGSAGGVGENPAPRAFYELLERIAVQEFLASQQTSVALLNEAAIPVGRAPVSDYFVSSDSVEYRYALSNGVGLGMDWQSACRSARLELIERDRVLRSWFGEFSPVVLPVTRLSLLSELSALYDWVPADFTGLQALNSLSVSGVFGFPKAKEHPLVYGLGASENGKASLAKAERECVQRLGFLWGESIPGEPPVFSVGPNFHQEYYLYPGHHQKLRDWLSGIDVGSSGTLVAPEQFRYVELTPPDYQGKFCVVRAISDGVLPLVFGHYPAALAERFQLNRRDSIHPMV